jgi:hypothetical protein
MYDNDKERVGHDATDFAAFGLSNPELRYIYGSNNDKTNTDKIDHKHVKFVTDVWEVLDGAGNLLIKKHEAYGPKNISQAPGGPENGLRVRMWDKMARLNHILENPNVDVNDESLDDTLKDLLNYCAIFIMVRKNQWPRD